MQYKQELREFILHTELLANLIEKASNIIAMISGSDDLGHTKEILTIPEHYDVLKQLRHISDYLMDLDHCVVSTLIDHVFKAHKPISPVEQRLVANYLLNLVHNDNSELFLLLSQSKNAVKSAKKITVHFVQNPIGTVNSPTYQFLYDAKTNTWQVQRFASSLAQPEIINDYLVKRTMKIVLAGITPASLHSCMENSLRRVLQQYEETLQNAQCKEAIKQEIKRQSSIFGEQLRDYCQSLSPHLPVLTNLHGLHTAFFELADTKSDLMAKLLFEDGLFELHPHFNLIAFLAKHIPWDGIVPLLQKESVKQALLKADWFDVHLLMKSYENHPGLSQFCFEYLSPELLYNLGAPQFRLAIHLPQEDYIRLRKQHKIQLNLHHFYSYQEALYEAHPYEFKAILAEYIQSGELITLPNHNDALMKLYISLFLEQEGQWLNLICNKSEFINTKFTFLQGVMKDNPKQTMAIFKAFSRTDALGNQYLPLALHAGEIAELIRQAPMIAYELLDYYSIIQTLWSDTISFEPYGEIRHFDHLYEIVRNIPPIYAQMLLASGLLFPEKGMPFFQHLTGFGMCGGKSPSTYIPLIFRELYEKLGCDTFMASLIRGLNANKKVHRLFLKHIENIDLLALATALAGFPSLKHLEIYLDLHSENQQNIRTFFTIMAATNPKLFFHIYTPLSHDITEFTFLSNYLSQNNIPVITLTVSFDPWANATLSKNTSFKKLFDNALIKILENNATLQQISLDDGFSSHFSSEKVYEFTQVPGYNTTLFALGDSSPDATSLLLQRNKNLHALKCISKELNHFRNSLELLPLLVLHGLPAEVILLILEKIRILQTQATTNSPYTKILKARQEADAAEQEANRGNDSFAKLASSLNVAKVFLQTSTLAAYFRHKPQEENRNSLKEFLNFPALEAEFQKAVKFWFEAAPSPMPAWFPFSNSPHQRSQSPLINTLDGLTNNDFTRTLNKLTHYQTAIKHCLQELQKEPLMLLQTIGPLDNTLAWNNLSKQVFDGNELTQVLAIYDLKKEISDSFFENIANFCGFYTRTESKLLTKIKETLENYLLYKAKGAVTEKHLYKTELLNLLRAANLVIFQKSKPRLYQILLTQGQRLEASLAKCVAKEALCVLGLFSEQHNRKKSWDKERSVDYETQINERLTQM